MQFGSTATARQTDLFLDSVKVGIMVNRFLSIAWLDWATMRLARSGVQAGALSRQLGALDRRRRLRDQHRMILSDASNPMALPPYPPRTRPPMS